MKTYYIMISKQFMKGHPREGQPTHFREKIECAVVKSEEHGKIHTMRENYEHWAHVAEEVNAGRGILSLRQWTGSPYNYQQDGSKQKEFLQLTKIGVQRASVTVYHVHSAPLPAMGIKESSYLSMGTIKVDGKEIQHYRDFYANDGFYGETPAEDFANWFGACIYENMALIHFTDFRY